MNEKITAQLTDHERHTADRLSLLSDLKRAKETEAQILADGKVSPTEVSQLADARGLAELISRRLPTDESALRQLDGEIAAELNGCLVRFNRAVCAAADAKAGQVVEALRPFFGDESERLGKLVSTLDIPAVKEIRSAQIETAFSAEPGLDFYAKHARSFLERSALAVAKFNLVVI